MRACWLKWVGRDWSISADYIWLNYSGANNWNQVSTDDLNKLLQQADKDQRQKVQESGMLEKSDERAVKLVKKQVSTFCGPDVRVNVEFED